MVNIINDHDYLFASDYECVKYLKIAENNYALIVKLNLKNANEANGFC